MTAAQSFEASSPATVAVATSHPVVSATLGIPVSTTGEVPRELGLARERLAAAGFTAKAGTTLAVARDTGPALVAIGIGDSRNCDIHSLREVAAACTRAVPEQEQVAIWLPPNIRLPIEAIAQAFAEGALLARYRYHGLREETVCKPLRELTLVVDREREASARAGAERGRVFASATILTRDLANTPHNHLTATRFAEVAALHASRSGLQIEVFDKNALIKMGCGGLLAVNAAAPNRRA